MRMQSNKKKRKKKKQNEHKIQRKRGGFRLENIGKTKKIKIFFIYTVRIQLFSRAAYIQPLQKYKKKKKTKKKNNHIFLSLS